MHVAVHAGMGRASLPLSLSLSTRTPILPDHPLRFARGHHRSEELVVVAAPPWLQGRFYAQRGWVVSGPQRSARRTNGAPISGALLSFQGATIQLSPVFIKRLVECRHKWERFETRRLDGDSEARLRCPTSRSLWPGHLLTKHQMSSKRPSPACWLRICNPWKVAIAP